MNKLVKIGAIVAGVLVVLVVALTILAKMLITPERVRATVVPIAEKALAREVHLGEIQVSLFSGISLHDLKIMEKDGADVFISTDQVVLRYRFWPLFFLQVVVDEVRLDKPNIRVVRKEDGSFNFSDLLSESAEAPEEKPSTSPPADDAGGAPPINLTIATVRLVGGDLLFIDQMINPAQPLRYQIAQLDVSADDIALDRAFPFEIACRINDAPLSVKGRADIAQQSGRAEISLKNFDVTAFSPYFHKQVPGRLDSMRIDLDLNAEGGVEQVISKGKIALTDIDLVLADLPDAPLRKASLALDYDVQADLKASHMTLRSSRVDFNGIVAEAAGHISNFAEAPQIALDVKVPALDVRKALAALPSALVKDAVAFDPAGVVEMTARLEGAADAGAGLLKNAQVVLKDVQADAGGLRPAINGALDLNGDQLVSRDLVVVAGENRARVDLNARNLFGEPIIVNHAVTSERFSIDALLQGSAAPAAASAAAPAAPAKDQPAEDIGPIELPLTVNGTVKIAETVYKGLAVNDFDLAYKLINNVLTVEKMTGRMVGGTFSQTARVDLGRKGLGYQTKINLQSLQADPFVTAFLPKAAGTFFGNMNLDLDLSGQGTAADTVKRNITGKGVLNLADGRVTGAGLAQGLADFLNLEELRVLRFSKFGGSFTIDQGRVRIDSALDGSDVRMKPQGTVGLDGALDLALNASLAPALMQKLDQRGQFTRFLTDQQGWGQLPLKVAGSYAQPRFAMDTAGVRQQVEEKAREELQRRVLDRVLPAKPEGEEDKPQDPARQLLDDAVRGLFRR